MVDPSESEGDTHNAERMNFLSAFFFSRVFTIFCNKEKKPEQVLPAGLSRREVVAEVLGRLGCNRELKTAVLGHTKGVFACLRLYLHRVGLEMIQMYDPAARCAIGVETPLSTGSARQTLSPQYPYVLAITIGYRVCDDFAHGDVYLVLGENQGKRLPRRQ